MRLNVVTEGCDDPHAAPSNRFRPGDRAARRLRTALMVLSAALMLFGLNGGCARKAAAPVLTQQEISEFHDAVNDGDAAIIDRLLAAKPALANAPDASGRRPLTVARQRGNEEAAEALRRHGAHE